MGQFVVIGLGNFGFNVASALSKLGHQVLAIDLRSKKVEKIGDIVTQAVVADTRDKEVLSEYMTDDVDAVIVGIGDNIEASTLTVLYLKDLKVKRIIAKAMSDDHGEILRLIGATEVIYPEKDEATRLAERLSIPNLIEHIPLAPEYSIVEIASPDSFIGKTLGELQLRRKYNIEIIAIKNVLLNTFDLIPGAGFKILADTALVIIGKKSEISKLKF